MQLLLWAFFRVCTPLPQAASGMNRRTTTGSLLPQYLSCLAFKGRFLTVLLVRCSEERRKAGDRVAQSPLVPGTSTSVPKAEARRVAPLSRLRLLKTYGRLPNVSSQKRPHVKQSSLHFQSASECCGCERRSGPSCSRRPLRVYVSRRLPTSPTHKETPVRTVPDPSYGVSNPVHRIKSSHWELSMRP